MPSYSLNENTGEFYPARGTSNDFGAIQEAMNAAVAAGGGAVHLGNHTWRANGSNTTGLKLNCGFVNLLSNRATLDLTAAPNKAYSNESDFKIAAITVENPAVTTARGKTLSQEIRNIIIELAEHQDGIYFHQPTNPNQEVAQLNVYNAVIRNGKNSYRMGSNAYCMKIHGGYLANSAVGIFRPLGTTNSGESMMFIGTTFSGNGQSVRVRGQNADMYFSGCSFDYVRGNYAFIDGNTATFSDAHFEAHYTATPVFPFEVDNGGVINIRGGDMGYTDLRESSNKNIFKVWGQGGLFRCTDMKWANIKYTEELTNRPDCLIMTGNSGGYTRSLTITPNASAEIIPNVGNGNYFTTKLTENKTYTVLAPLNKYRDASLKIAFRRDGSNCDKAAIMFDPNAYVFAEGVPAMPPGQNATLIISANYDFAVDKWRCTYQSYRDI